MSVPCWMGWVGSQVNKFKQVSSGRFHVLGEWVGRMPGVWGEGEGIDAISGVWGWGRRPHAWCPRGEGSPLNRQTPVKTLPSRKFVCGRQSLLQDGNSYENRPRLDGYLSSRIN